MNFGFRISDFGFASHPSGSEPPRHQCKFRIRNSESEIPTQPSLSQRRGAEAQRRRESCQRLHRTARSRPSDDGRSPLGQETAPKTSFRSDFLAQRPVLCERRPRRFSFLFNSWEKYTSLPVREKVRQNRRASGASTGEKTESDGCSHPERTGFLPVTGDHSIAGRSAVNKRDHISHSAFAPLRLCDFASLRSFLGERTALRFCVSASLRFSWCSPLASWCLGGFSFSQSSENRP